MHFPPDTDPAAIGHKALAVNLSDLAAMGAEPAWAMLALTLPAPDEAWLASFSAGFCALAREHRVALIGGDTTRGPLSITVQVHGFVPRGGALRRGGARAGDLIHVTGTLGDAGLALRLARRTGLECASADLARLRARLDRPSPRVAQGLQLRGRAHAAIDVSDGLLADLGHILEAGGVGATLRLDRLPLSDAFRACIASLDGHRDAAAALALTAGDDYELCFTTAPDMDDLGILDGVACTRIGVIEPAPGLRCLRADGTPWRPAVAGYDHFGDLQPGGDLRPGGAAGA